MKYVLLEGRASGWILHSLYKELTCCPPEGYSFLVEKNGAVPIEGKVQALNKILVKNQFVKFQYDIMRPILYYAYRITQKTTIRKYDLLYASQHIDYGKMPWIVDLEHAGALAAYGNINVLGNIVEKYLSSDCCKKIIPWSNMAKESLLYSYDCRKFVDKIEVVNLAVRPKNFVKLFNDDVINLLFVGTANPINIADSFAMKGGLEVLEAFDILSKKYSNIKLTVRSYVPSNIKTKYGNLPNVEIIDTPLPHSSLDMIFKQSAIFLFPAHSTPGMAILDAMSYELPVIATDVWATNEQIEDGKNGLLIKGRPDLSYFDEKFIPRWGTPSFMNKLGETEPRMLADLVEKTSMLIEDEKLRRRLGRTGRQLVETGKFSTKLRNQKLRKIFDEATQ